jgi:two-component system chemotaxis response regulator CheB
MLAARPMPAVRPVRQNRVDIIVIGASTGGPDALTAIASKLPGDLAVPVVVVQHMPPLFTRLFASRLDRSCPLTVTEAVDGQLIKPGSIIVAPGDQHLAVRRQGTDLRVHLTQDPPENYCRPSVDVLFRSAAAVAGAGVLACVLTGMGRDGTKGAERIRAVGGRVVVQDAASSVVWGMPGAVVAAGHANDIVPMDRIADTLLTGVASGRRPSGRALPSVPPAAMPRGTGTGFGGAVTIR